MSWDYLVMSIGFLAIGFFFLIFAGYLFSEEKSKKPFSTALLCGLAYVFFGINGLCRYSYCLGISDFNKSPKNSKVEIFNYIPIGSGKEN